MTSSLYASLLAFAAGAVLVCAVTTLWLGATRAVVRLLAVQGVALGVVALVLGAHLHDVALLATAAVVIGVKGVAIPLVLGNFAGRDPASREARPLVNVPASLVAATALTFLAYATTRQVVALVPTVAGRLVPVGFATLLIGFFALVSRRKPVFQMVGLLLVDNGIALVAFLLTAGVPLLIELGVSLDVLLGVVVLQAVATRLRTEFGDLDLDQLQELHD